VVLLQEFLYGCWCGLSQFPFSLVRATVVHGARVKLAERGLKSVRWGRGSDSHLDNVVGNQ
jgi:hypothetical protein